MSGRILIVDDDASQRRSLAIGLRLNGFDVHAVGDGLSALAMAQERSFDIVLVDLMMPGLNGLQLVRRMAEQHPDVPVVLMSGYHLSRSQLSRVGLNAVGFVPKPYRLDELSNFLHNRLPTSDATIAHAG